MDTYQGSIFEPATLHKYLYANANPVMYNDPSGNMFASIAISSVFNSIQEKIHTLKEIAIYHSLKNAISSIFSTYISKNVVNLVVGTLTVAVMAEATLILKDVMIEDVLNGINSGVSKLANVYAISAGILGMILTAATDIKQFGKIHKYPTAIHHIVEKSFELAQPARDVLHSVGINLCDNYTTAQLVAAERAGEPNLTKIKAITHQAIHNQLCNTIYTTWVNIVMVASQSDSRPKLVNYLSAVDSLAMIEGTIKAADALL